MNSHNVKRPSLRDLISYPSLSRAQRPEGAQSSSLTISLISGQPRPGLSLQLRGQCRLRPRGGESPAHGSPRCGRHLLRLLQDHTRSRQHDDSVSWFNLIFCAISGVHCTTWTEKSITLTTSGWKYEHAFESSQKYKEGKFIIELAHMIKENGWEKESWSGSSGIFPKERVDDNFLKQQSTPQLHHWCSPFLKLKTYPIW